MVKANPTMLWRKTGLARKKVASVLGSMQRAIHPFVSEMTLRPTNKRTVEEV